MSLLLSILNSFDEQASVCLVRLYSPLIEDVQKRITEVLDVLQHDGYLCREENRYRFESRLLKDWWCARYRGHYQPLCDRLGLSGTTKEVKQ